MGPTSQRTSSAVGGAFSWTRPVRFPARCRLCGVSVPPTSNNSVIRPSARCLAALRLSRRIALLLWRRQAYRGSFDGPPPTVLANRSGCTSSRPFVRAVLRQRSLDFSFLIPTWTLQLLEDLRLLLCVHLVPAVFMRTSLLVESKMVPPIRHFLVKIRLLRLADTVKPLANPLALF